MSALTSYEVEVLRLLASSVIPIAELEAVSQEAKFIDYEYTGSGYFLTVEHDSFPTEAITCFEPIVMGHSGSIDCGFVLHFADGRLSLECHTWGAVDVPEGFRERQVNVRIHTDFRR